MVQTKCTLSSKLGEVTPSILFRAIACVLFALEIKSCLRNHISHGFALEAIRRLAVRQRRPSTAAQSRLLPGQSLSSSPQ